MPRAGTGAQREGAIGLVSGRASLVFRFILNCTSFFCRLAAFRDDLREGRPCQADSKA